MDSGLRARQRQRHRQRQRRNRRNFILFCVAVVFIIIFSICMKGCGGKDETKEAQTPAPTPTPAPVATPEPQKVPQNVDEIIAEMSLDDKILQLMIVDIDTLTGVSNTTLYGNTSMKKITDYPVGGLVYDSGNIESKSQATVMLSNTQNQYISENYVPAFLATTESAGDISAIAQTLMTDPSSELAYNSGAGTANNLKSFGFNLNLSPYVAMNETDDTENFSSAAAGIGNGMRDGRVIPLYNKFPQQMITSTSKEQAMEKELFPWRIIIQGGADMIMMSETPVPALTGVTEPYLASSFIETTLRSEMDFSGVIVTPPLSGLPTEKYIEALLAGCDMLYLPDSIDAAKQAVKDAVTQGVITEDRITQSVRRVLLLKKSLG
ncbi:MAG: glycoside hydrolase family 3 N-terminal domain-containing protein [Clostridia bacterium]|nr:glycoside hydrolase family 3 N-terminal domain-containing protein [Clostridia bacterium]